MIWLDPAEHDRIAEEACRRRLVETGGPLFGYSVEDAVVITRAFGPGPGARHRPRSFSASPDWIERCIEEMFNESGGAISYVGEWHSHPLSHASPSGKDIAAVAEIAAQAEVDLPRPTILIQSTKIFHRHVHLGDLGAYRWDAGELAQQQLIIDPSTAVASN